jgi:hypothetical protein
MNSCVGNTGSPWWIDTMVILTTLGSVVFVTAYARLAPWRSTLMGKHVMTSMVVILIVSGMATAAVFFGNQWPGRNIIRFLAWSSICTIIWWRVYLLVYAQRGVVPGQQLKRGGP